MHLDDLLDRSAPPAAARTPELRRELDDLVLATESVVRPRRRALRGALAGAVGLGVIGVGTAGAMAAGVVSTPAWVPWSTGSGSTCHMEFSAEPAGADGEPGSRHRSDAEQLRAADEASAFLETFDFASIDTDQAIRDWQRKEAAAVRGQAAPSERQPRLSGDDLEITAVGSVVWARLERHLEAGGIADPAALLSFSQAWRCDT